MKITINKKAVETVRFGSLAAGSLFRVPSDKEEYIQIKTDDGFSVALLYGAVDDGISPEDYVVDVTDKYKLIDA